MKYILFLIVLFTLPVTAEEVRDWHWRSGSSAWNGWFETKGLAKVDIKGREISATLYDHELQNFERIKFSGSVHGGNAEIVVTVLAMKGTYAIREFNGENIEALIFKTEWRFLALTRRSAATTPNKASNPTP